MGKKMHRKREKRTNQRFANLLALVSKTKDDELIKLKEIDENKKPQFLYANGKMYDVLKSLCIYRDGVPEIMKLKLRHKMELNDNEFEVE